MASDGGRPADDFRNGFIAGCTGTGAAVLVVGTVAALLKTGDGFAVAVISAIVAMVLAAPATLIGWLMIRSMPAGTWNAVRVGLLGCGLGLMVVGAFALAGKLSGPVEGTLRFLALAAFCGAAGAENAWFSGFRREVRVR